MYEQGDIVETTAHSEQLVVITPDDDGFQYLVSRPVDEMVNIDGTPFRFDEVIAMSDFVKPSDGWCEWDDVITKVGSTSDLGVTPL